MKVAIKNLISVLAIFAALFAIAILFSRWFGAKELRLFGVDAWLVLDRATILSSLILLSITIYGTRPGGWVRRVLSPKSSRFNQLTHEILEDSKVLIMLYHNSDAAKDIIGVFGPHIEMLILVASKPEIPPNTKYLSTDQFFDYVRTKFSHIRREGSEIIDDARDLHQAKQAVLRAIDRAEKLVRLGAYTPDRITCDLTGGYKPMTLGMLEAAKDKGVLAVYTTAKRRPDDTVEPGSHDLIVICPRSQNAVA